MTQTPHRRRHRFLELLRHHTKAVEASWLPCPRTFVLLAVSEPGREATQDLALLARFTERREAFDALQRSVGALPYTCPACGFPALKERAAHETCSLCGWQDDGRDGSESLHDARLSYGRMLQRPRILTPDTGGRRAPPSSAAQDAGCYIEQLADGVAPGAASLLRKAASIR